LAMDGVYYKRNDIGIEQLFLPLFDSLIPDHYHNPFRCFPHPLYLST
jgi:hypothetical protein